jgi:hypothetical protein
MDRDLAEKLVRAQAKQAIALERIADALEPLAEIIKEEIKEVRD